MFVTILHRIDGEKDEDSCGFKDVADNMYYSKAVAWASKNGIVKGISETEFDPDSNITREQIAECVLSDALRKIFKYVKNLHKNSKNALLIPIFMVLYK